MIRKTAQRISAPKATMNHAHGSTMLAWQLFSVIVLVIGFLFAEQWFNNKAKLVLQVGNQERVFEGEVVRGMTVLDAFNAAMLAGNINLQFAVQNDQTRILELDGIANLTPQNMVFYINSERIDSQRLNKVTVQPQDEIVVKVNSTR